MVKTNVYFFKNNGKYYDDCTYEIDFESASDKIYIKSTEIIERRKSLIEAVGTDYNDMTFVCVDEDAICFPLMIHHYERETALSNRLYYR